MVIFLLAKFPLYINTRLSSCHVDYALFSMYEISFSAREIEKLNETYRKLKFDWNSTSSLSGMEESHEIAHANQSLVFKSNGRR